jgi:phage gp16-like protein
MATISAEQRRKRDLAAIHASKKQLGLDDDTYRELLVNVTGLRSAKDLNADQRRAVLARMRQQGGNRPRSTPVGQHAGTPANLAREPMLQKIEALLVELQAPWSYADGIAARMFKIQRVAWLRKQDQRMAVIAALDAELFKRRARAFIAAGLKRLGMSEATLVATLRLPTTWTSRKASLQAAQDYVGAAVELLDYQEGVR